MCEICSKITLKTPEQRQLRLFGVFIVNFKQISHISLVFPLLTLNNYITNGKGELDINSIACDMVLEEEFMR